MEKKNCDRPTGFNFSHPLHRKQIFFYGQPKAGVGYSPGTGVGEVAGWVGDNHKSIGLINSNERPLGIMYRNVPSEQ